MNKKQISKLLILLMSVIVITGKSFADTEAEQTIQTSVQPTVSIEKQNSSIESGSVNANGVVNSSLKSIFKLQTNGSDENYDFIVTSYVLTEGGKVSAYGENGCILFGHTLALPTQSAINDAKVGGNENDNVIAYPVTTSITEPLTVEYSSNNSSYGDCYVVKVNNGSQGVLTHSIGQTPVSNTYNLTRDISGTYQATVVFTAVSK